MSRPRTVRTFPSSRRDPGPSARVAASATDRTPIDLNPSRLEGAALALAAGPALGSPSSGGSRSGRGVDPGEENAKRRLARRGDQASMEGRSFFGDGECRKNPSGLSSAALAVGVELDSPPEGRKVEVELGQNVAGGSFRVDSSASSGSGRGLVRLNPRGPNAAPVFDTATVAVVESIPADPGLGQGRTQAGGDGVRRGPDVPGPVGDPTCRRHPATGMVLV